MYCILLKDYIGVCATGLITLTTDDKAATSSTSRNGVPNSRILTVLSFNIHPAYIPTFIYSAVH